MRVGHSLQRLVGHHQGGDEADDFTLRDLAANDARAADQHHSGNADAAQKISDGACRCFGAEAAAHVLQHSGNRLIDAADFALFLSIGFDNTDAAQRFGDER